MPGPRPATPPLFLPHRLADAVAGRAYAALWSRRFGRWGAGTRLYNPAAIEGAANIHLGADVLVAAHSCLAANPATGAENCRLEIGDGCRIGRFNHIYATRRIIFGRRVLTANGVYVADNRHEFADPNLAVLDQPVRQLADVVIGDGAWLGHNVCIIGASIGRNAVVGANAVVTRDLPDHCVAVGAPARIIRRFDPGAGVWRATSADGRFTDDA
jgi:acetyltransferase-like isoleucine patch superfamily enzyme